MPSKEDISFPCLEVTQPIGTFYIGVMQAQDVVYIARADIRHIEDDDIGLAVGIQRRVSPKRVKEIAAYIETLDATFPTSVILAAESRHVKYHKREKVMRIERSEDIVTVIDGQHRLKGLEDIESRFDLNVTMFIDMETQDKAMVFSTINLAQTKVNKSLVYDLYEYATTRSPQKTCHDIAKLLNYENNSPFYRKIKILGTASEHPEETLTQAGFVEPLLELISRDPLGDRDALRRRKKLKKVSDLDERRLVFRNMFIEERDAEIAKVVWNYFSAVSKRWQDAWPESERGKILNRTTGFRALMRFLRDVYVSFGKPGKVPSAKRFLDVLKKARLGDSDFTPDKYQPGSGGERALLQDLRSQTKIAEYSRG